MPDGHDTAAHIRVMAAEAAGWCPGVAAQLTTPNLNPTKASQAMHDMAALPKPPNQPKRTESTHQRMH